MTSEERKRIFRRAWAEGLSHEEIANAIGRSVRSVERIARSLGIPPRLKPVSEEERASIIERARNGESITSIRLTTGRGSMTIARILDEAHVKRRKFCEIWPGDTRWGRVVKGVAK